jgi:hypothetical protein
MSALDTAIASYKRRKTKPKSKTKSKPIPRAEAAPRQQQRKATLETSHRIPRVIPWLEWVKIRGISVSTAERLQRAGKVKVTYLSPRRKGVREDHDREFLDSCARSGAPDEVA